MQIDTSRASPSTATLLERLLALPTLCGRSHRSPLNRQGIGLIHRTVPGCTGRRPRCRDDAGAEDISGACSGLARRLGPARAPLGGHGRQLAAAVTVTFTVSGRQVASASRARPGRRRIPSAVTAVTLPDPGRRARAAKPGGPGNPTRTGGPTVVLAKGRSARPRQTRRTRCRCAAAGRGRAGSGGARRPMLAALHADHGTGGSELGRRVRHRPANIIGRSAARPPTA